MEQNQQTGSVLELIGMIYFGIGATVTSITICSAAIYYTFGPGAFWNIGFIAWLLGGGFAMLSSLIRVVTWPYGLYILITNTDGFLPWLFYLWYQ